MAYMELSPSVAFSLHLRSCKYLNFQTQETTMQNKMENEMDANFFYRIRIFHSIHDMQIQLIAAHSLNKRYAYAYYCHSMWSFSNTAALAFAGRTNELICIIIVERIVIAAIVHYTAQSHFHVGIVLNRL